MFKKLHSVPVNKDERNSMLDTDLKIIERGILRAMMNKDGEQLVRLVGEFLKDKGLSVSQTAMRDIPRNEKASSNTA